MLMQDEGLKKVIITSERLRRHENIDNYKCGNWREEIESQFLNRMKVPPKLDSPQTFNEKLQWLKLYWRNVNASICANKWTMRQYVAEKGYEHLLHPYLAVWKSADEIDFRNLPDSFIIKAAHVSGMNLIIQDKSSIDLCDVKDAYRVVLQMQYYAVKYEWVYEREDPILICEDLFPNEENIPLDYKFFCFNGKVKAVQVLTATDTVGATDDTTAYFCDENLKPLHVRYGYEPLFTTPVKPSCYDEMIRAAEALSTEFAFVRIDFCVSKGKPWIGEFTFFPAAGYDRFEPDSFDILLGTYLNLKDISENEKKKYEQYRKK